MSLFLLHLQNKNWMNSSAESVLKLLVHHLDAHGGNWVKGLKGNTVTTFGVNSTADMAEKTLGWVKSVVHFTHIQ